MANKFYVPGARRARRVNDLFAAIAPHYDLINDLQSFGLHRWWKRRLIRLAGVRAGDIAVEIAALHQLARDHGRDPRSLSVSVYGAPGDADQVRRLQDAGVDRVLFILPPAPADVVLPLLDRYAEVARQVG